MLIFGLKKSTLFYLFTAFVLTPYSSITWNYIHKSKAPMSQLLHTLYQTTFWTLPPPTHFAPLTSPCPPAASNFPTLFFLQCPSDYLSHLKQAKYIPRSYALVSGVTKKILFKANEWKEKKNLHICPLSAITHFNIFTSLKKGPECTMHAVHTHQVFSLCRNVIPLRAVEVISPLHY